MHIMLLVSKTILCKLMYTATRYILTSGIKLRYTQKFKQGKNLFRKPFSNFFKNPIFSRVLNQLQQVRITGTLRL